MMGARIARPALYALAGSLSLAAMSCGGDGGGLFDAECEDPQLGAKLEALNAATDGLVMAAGDLKLEVGQACANIATDLGEDGVPTINGDSSDQDVEAACTAATAAIEAQVDAGVTIEVAIEGGGCEVNASAQFDCEAKCDVDGECDPGELEVRCDPGELSVQCQGECSGGAYCEGTAEVAANCEGSCEGTCTGQCDGTCSAENGDGECEGACEGTCSGTCSGSCKLDATANIECGADVRCRGGCMGEFEAPRCEGTIEPPSCMIEAECQAGCDGQAKFEAMCEKPSIKVYVSAGADAMFQATLEDNLPVIIDAFRFKGKLLVSAAGDVADAFGGAVQAAAQDASCAVQAAGSLAANAAASVEASASVSVSFQASASVGGSCGVPMEQE